MTAAFAMGLALFSACWLVHVAIWRVRRPGAYLVWLPVIFFALPLLAVLGMIAAGGQDPILSRVDAFSLLAGALLHIVLALSYLCGYAGVIEYSPSAEILRVVRDQMPQGVPLEALRVDSLTDEFLTGKRISHLRHSRLVRSDESGLRLTGAGEALVAGCQLYRAVFGIRGSGKG